MIASGGNAGLACAWAAQQHDVPAVVFLPATAPKVRVARLRSYGADVRLVGAEYADALAACEAHAAETGALASHAYDHPLIAAGAGTLLEEILQEIPVLDTVVAVVGGGGLFADVATAAQQHGVRTVADEPENCRALAAARAAGHVVDVTVDSVAADSLGARRTSEMALQAALQDNVLSVLVPDDGMMHARKALWDHGDWLFSTGRRQRSRPCSQRTAAHRGRPAPGLRAGGDPRDQLQPAPGEKVCVVLCCANTDPSDLV
jgi:threonine dehydratase